MKFENELIELLDQAPSEASGGKTTVTAGDLFRSDAWRNESEELPLMIGEGMDGKIFTLDLATAMDLLIAGSTGSGKSVFMDMCLFSLMLRHTPKELKLILVDSKAVEFIKYKDLPYLQFPVITNTRDTLKVLHWLNTEMVRRQQLLAEANCREIRDLNAQKANSLPYIVIFIDDLADAMLKERTIMEHLLESLSGAGRPLGIHFVISTQRPDARVLTRGIKSTFFTRIAFQVPSATNSRTILDSEGAEQLRGRGDMLCKFFSELRRIQGGFINQLECTRILERIRSIYKDFEVQMTAPLPELEEIDDDIVIIDGDIVIIDGDEESE